MLKANKKNRFVYGVGVNDAGYTTSKMINFKNIVCVFYNTWTNMLERCYSPRLQAKYPTYIGCTVAEEWHLFSNFKSWMVSQDWEGKQLDKDILVPGNKLYSPETCVFVSKKVNTLFNGSHKSPQNNLPKGVRFHKIAKKYQAGISINGKQKHLGLFDMPEQAEAAYKKARVEYITRIAITQPDKRVREALLLRAQKMSVS